MLNFLLKQAFATYDYGGSRSRNFTPTKPAAPIVINEQSNEKAHPAKKLKAENLDVPTKGSNKNAGNWYSEFEFIHSFYPTISGTGFGRKYWQDQKNPYEV